MVKTCQEAYIIIDELGQSNVENTDKVEDGAF